MSVVVSEGTDLAIDASANSSILDGSVASPTAVSVRGAH